MRCAPGRGDLFVAGGVESMRRAPFVFAQGRARRSGAATRPRGTRRSAGASRTRGMEEMFPLESMGETGENVAERWDVSREDQDAFALESQRRWAAAQEAGRFADELVPVGDVDRDEHPRPDTSAEKLAALKPAFREGGTVTAGNSSGDQRRRRGARDRERGAGRRPRRRAARAVRRERGRGRRSAGHGHRPGAGRAQGARARRDRRRATSTSSS